MLKVKRYRVQGEVTIYVDYVEEDADSKEIALKAAKDWVRQEHKLIGLGFDDYDISLTAEELEEEGTL